MNEFDYLYNDEFFILSSDNLNNIESKLYGFAVTDDGIIFDNPNVNKLDGNGCYIYISKENNKISIYQDFFGSYGLYVYNVNNYFAISNSFIKLVDFLKEKVTINFNLDYAHAYITAPASPSIYKETLVEEIQILPYDYIININIEKGILEYSKIDYNEKTVPIDSIECLNILDKWYLKWINIFNFLYKNTDNLRFSLSGGFDSRVLLALLLSSNVNLNNINILTFINDKPTFIEDYEIASEIASDFGFELNKHENKMKKYYFKEVSTSINLSYYLRGGFAKQMYWKTFIFSEKYYHIRGFGGELLRNFIKDPSIDSFITNHVFRAQDYSINSSQSTEKILKRTFEEYNQIYDNLTERDLLSRHYMRTRHRNYMGTQISEEYLTNNIILSPLMDPILNKIHINTENDEFMYLLPCLILLRYCPKLLSYKFEGNRKINDSTITLATKINNLSEFKKTENEVTILNLDLENKIKYSILSEEEQLTNNNQYTFLKDIFNSAEFKKLFTSHFSKLVYNKVYTEEKKLFPDSPSSDLNSVIITMKIIESVLFSHQKQRTNPYDWLDGLKNYPLNIAPELENDKKIDDARIDFKNVGGKDNDVIILDISDYKARILKPDWFTNFQGIGLTIETGNTPLKIKLKCVHDGELHIKLKSRDIWDENNERIPISYEKVFINSESILDDVKIASHDHEIILKRKAKDGDIFNIIIEWKSFKNDK